VKPICRYEFDAAAIVSRYPARIDNRNKAVVFGVTSPPGARHSGRITFTRWRPVPLPSSVERGNDYPAYESREEFFTYEAPPDGRTDWYLNFAHHDLFAFYGGALFAQDEMQVAEHPALASLRHALMAKGEKALTVEDGIPTPALITGVERRCVISTDPNPDEGRPEGLYGNSFARGTEEAVRRATRPIDPPTRSNILAMEAPAHGTGRYKMKEIDYILSTAVTGFSAAVHQTRTVATSPSRVAIHTGYWGCGAYGGDRTLMALLQMLAAAIARVEVLVFHTGGDDKRYRAAESKLDELLPPGNPVNCQKLLAKIDSMGFRWGVGDGN
jgi:hypothetical protein